MSLQSFLAKKGKAPAGSAEKWLALCTLDVTTGSLWAGDPHGHTDDGHVTKVPPGRYVVEGIGGAERGSRFVSRLRVRLQSVKDCTLGKELGETGTDSAMIGVCDLKAFQRACAGGSEEEVHEAIEAQTDRGFGIAKLRKFPGAIMPFVPIGSDGSGPVHALVAGRKRIGIELPLTSASDDGTGDRSKKEKRSNLLGNDRDTFITRVLADGSAASFWVGGKLEAGKKFYLWSNAASGPIEYQIRRKDVRAATQWSRLKKKGDQSFAVTSLGAGTFEIHFRIGKNLYSALKITLS
jgi:hypothetical protein